MNLDAKLKQIPHAPGCYLWKQKNRILYIGKAKDLAKRTHQYFQNRSSLRIAKLVSQIDDVDYIVTRNEIESLLLEINLIKKHQPPYNVELKNNSTYPYIGLTNETHPRIVYTINPHSRYKKLYGPFPLGSSPRDVYHLLNLVFPFRKCRKLPDQKCVYYDIKECWGPCINKFPREKYEVLEKKLDQFFHGNIAGIMTYLKNRELQAAENHQYEQAREFFQLQTKVQQMLAQQIVDLPTNSNLDVLGYFQADDYLAVNLFAYINGQLVKKHQQLLHLHEPVSTALNTYLSLYYDRFMGANKLYLSGEIENDLVLPPGIKGFYPQRGKYRQVLELATLNARNYYDREVKNYQSRETQVASALVELATFLNLPAVPTTIEVIDVSHFLGDNPAAGVIVWSHGKLQKSAYRLYNLTNDNSKSDLDSMYEVAYRHFHSKLLNKGMLPDLVLVDGSWLQVAVFSQVLTQLRLTQVAIAGLKKNENHDTAFLVKSKTKQLNVTDKPALYQFLGNLQDNVHRYVITHVRRRTAKSLIANRLTEIPGLGIKRSRLLMREFGSLDRIKNASVLDLVQLLKPKLAQEVYQFFHSRKE